MFARKVSALLKPNSVPEFANLMELEVLPWLRKQEGFRDLITLVVPDGAEVATISFWDHEVNAESYNASGFPQALEILGKLLLAGPYVKTFDVVSSSLHGSETARAAAEQLRETRQAQLEDSAFRVRRQLGQRFKSNHGEI